MSSTNKLALCSILTTRVIISNFSFGTFNQVLNAEIIAPLNSFPGFEVIYVYGSKIAYQVVQEKRNVLISIRAYRVEDTVKIVRPGVQMVNEITHRFFSFCPWGRGESGKKIYVLRHEYREGTEWAGGESKGFIQQ
jgi:hypothetical protein